MNYELARGSMERLCEWLNKNGYLGWDPYDIKGTKFYTKLYYKKGLLSKIIKKLFDVLESRFPLLIRRIMNINPEVNAKAMGLLLNAYVNLYNIFDDEGYLNKAFDAANWLEENYNRNYKGCSWGYPFNWNSIVFIPKNTPSSIASVTIGEGFYQLYKTTNNDKYLDFCKKICVFLTEELYISVESSEEICFSYTPLDKYQVHNINLLIADFLIKVGKLLNCSRYIDLGIKAANFSISQQNSDGSIYYWSKKQNKNNINHLDLYHSGFEIRALYGIYKNTGLDKYKNSYKMYLDFFVNNYFTEKHIKIKPNLIFPIDIHACSEAINCLSIVFKENTWVEEKLDFSLRYTIENMQTDKGWFAYKIFKSGRKSKIPYLRWGQAWMIKSLSEYLLIVKGK